MYSSQQNDSIIVENLWNGPLSLGYLLLQYPSSQALLVYLTRKCLFSSGSYLRYTMFISRQAPQPSLYLLKLTWNVSWDNSSEKEEECEFWQVEYWVMCEAEPHGIWGAEWGCHLLRPEASRFVANFTIRWWTVVCSKKKKKKKRMFVFVNMWQSAGEPS